VGWPTLFGVVLVVLGAVLLALVDIPRRVFWWITQLFRHATHRPKDAEAEASRPGPPGLWVHSEGGTLARKGPEHRAGSVTERSGAAGEQKRF